MDYGYKDTKDDDAVYSNCISANLWQLCEMGISWIYKHGMNECKWTVNVSRVHSVVHSQSLPIVLLLEKKRNKLKSPF